MQAITYRGLGVDAADLIAAVNALINDVNAQLTAPAILVNQTLTIDSGGTIATDGADYAGVRSYQPIGPDLNLAATAGRDVADGTSFLAPVMGNIIGASLTKTGTYLAGLIGAYSITGAKGSHYEAAGVLGIVMDGVTTADGAFMAVIDGDSGVVTANAAFGAAMNNSNAGSGFNYGLDLYFAAHDGYLQLAILKALLRSPNQVCILEKAGVPTDGGAGTGQGFAGPGSLCIDYTNANMYINANTAASPTWKLVTRAA